MSEAISIIALHGFLGVPEEWEPVFARLSEKWKLNLFTPSLPGHLSKDWLRPDDFFEDCLEKIKAMPPPRVLLGYSMGGRLAMRMIEDEPELFQSVFMLSSAFDPPENVAQSQTSFQQIKKSLQDKSYKNFLEDWYQQALFSGIASRPELKAQVITNRLQHSVKGLVAALEAFHRSRFHFKMESLIKYSNKCFFYYGERDSKYRAEAIRYQSRLPDLQVREIPELSHALIAEAPERLAEYLEKDILSSIFKGK